MWVGVVRRMADHPRSRGVYDRHPRPVGAEFGSSPLARGLLRQANGQQEITGSSPLARGLHGVAAADLVHDGIIPARAGFTCAGGRPPWRRSDHPRSRGVYAPPVDAGDVPVGIIPARAGFTRIGGRLFQRGKDHPRSRGVYAARKVGAIMADGSSPLARGLRRVWPVPHAGAGIIPARAGFTRRGRPG